MSVLHNKISNQELKEKMLAETEKRVTVSFYKYFEIDNPQKFRDEFYQTFEPMKLFGRIYIAREGLNAQASIPESQYQKFVETLENFHEALKGNRINIAVDDDGKSFWVLRVKTREKIVADGISDPTFNSSNMGRHLDALEFNQMADDQNTIIVDMRNHYEYEVGHFQNAIEVPSDTFREQLPMAVEMLAPEKDKNIVMYCTGGIRCEKASAYLKHNGFKNVFQLEGGIIEYARKVKEQNLPVKFVGKNFVFDERLGERITDHVISACHQCGEPCDAHTNCANEACHLLFIQCENCAKNYAGCCSEDCQQTLSLPDDERKKARA